MSDLWNMNVPGIIDGYNGPETVVVVPSEVDGVPVTALTGGVFNAMKITSLVVPDGVDIAEANGICLGCERLEQVTLGNGVTAIPVNGFSGCGLLNSFTCTAPYSSIGNQAFYSCSSLELFEVPASVISIGESCFVGESSMGSIYFLGDAPTCGSSVFYSTAAVGYYPNGNTTYSNPWNGLQMIERSL